MATTIKLPAPKTDGGMALARTIALRRSQREYRPCEMAPEQLAQLLWSAQGITAPGVRAVPSAGAQYPMEVYVVAGNVSGVPAGIYRYRPAAHELAEVSAGDSRAKLAKACLEQTYMQPAPAILVIAAVFERVTGKYGRRGVQYVYQESGHIGQNVALTAVAMGMGTVMVGAFDDAAVARIVGLRQGEVPLYVIPVGPA